MKLPDDDIVVVHRSDGSGTTFVFTDYLVEGQLRLEDRKWARTLPSAGRSGSGGKGNDGVAGIVKQTPNSIGYVELIYRRSRTKCRSPM